MKKKIFLISLLTFVTVCLLAITASAQSHNVTYYNLWSELQETVSTDDNGKITIKTTGYATEENKSLICWYTMEGDVYRLGQEVTLTEDVSLYEGYGYLGELGNMGYTAGSNQWDQAFIQLQEDLVLDYDMSPPWGGRLIIDLNGHTITTSGTNAFNQQRSGLVLVGKGKVIHTGTGHFFNCSTHGYGDGQQRLIIGKDVSVSTNGTLFNYTNGTGSVIPIRIYGEATCAKVCHINNLRHNFDVKINSKKLTVTGEVFMSLDKYEGGAISIEISGGMIELGRKASTKDYWNNGSYADYSELFNIMIDGGVFNVSADNINGYIVDGNKIVRTELNGVVYSAVVNNTCNHNYELTDDISASCIQLAGKIYTCKECHDVYTILYGSYAEHSWELTSDKEPSLASAGEKIYACTVCSEVKSELYFSDVANEEIKVIITTENGEKEVTVKVSDVFELVKNDGNGYTLTGLKDFGEYKATDIVAINIPLGIEEINFTSDNSTLKRLIINDNAVVAVKSFVKYTALTHIEIEAATVSFERDCSNKVIESIKSEKQGANVTFKRKVFLDKKTLVELKLSPYSKYVFYGNSFQNTGITQLIAPDYSDVVFLKGGVFYGCKSLELVYLGRGIKRIDGDVFNYCSNLQKAILVDVNEMVCEGAFAHIVGTLKPLEVYIHNSSAYIPRYAFQDSDGVIVYTNTPIPSKYPFDRCDAKTYNGVDYPKYTIYLGIGHKYVEAYKYPTCTDMGVDGYVADCLCGEELNDQVTVRVYYGILTGEAPSETITYSAKLIPAYGHTEGEVTYIDYINGYVSNGLKQCICKVCSEAYTEESPTAAPIFKFLGYSMPEDGGLEISFGFIIDKEMMSLYEGFSGASLEYGVVIALADKLNGKAPLDEGAEADSVTLNRSYTCFNLRVSGFTEAHKDLGVVMAMYVKTTNGDESTVVYLQGEQTELPKSISINQYLQGN